MVDEQLHLGGKQMLLVATYDASTSFYKFYSNGTLVGGDFRYLEVFCYSLNVGKGDLSSDVGFAGDIHRVRFWDGALSAAEVQALSE